MGANETDGRREAARAGVLKSAKIVTGQSVLNCVVLDVSERGARVRLEAMTMLPERVMLCFRGGAAFNATRRWARAQEVGLEFAGSAALTARTAADASAMAQKLQASGLEPALAALREIRHFDDPQLAAEAQRALEAYRTLCDTLNRLSRADAWEPPDVFNP